MKRFKNILFVLDQNQPAETAITRAVALARNNGARLTVASLAEPAGLEALWIAKIISRPTFAETLEEAQLARLQELTAPLEKSGVPIETRLLKGKLFIEVVRQVLREKHDLLIKPVENWSSETPATFGSSDMHLMRKCPCPVWIMKPTAVDRYTTILAAVDPYAETGEGSELAVLIMDLATSLAASEGAELHIVHAWRLPNESMLRHGRGALPKAEVDELVRKARREREAALNRLVQGYSLAGLGARVHLIQGEAAAVIREQTERNQVDLIVMGTVGRTGLPGFFIGNTAENVISRVHASVLAVKPAGFVTPVVLED